MGLKWTQNTPPPKRMVKLGLELTQEEIDLLMQINLALPEASMFAILRQFFTEVKREQ